MPTVLHSRLMRLVLELQQRGDADLAKWILKWIAHEQKKKKRRRGERKVKVRLGPRGREAWIPERLVKRAKEMEQCE